MRLPSDRNPLRSWSASGWQAVRHSLHPEPVSAAVIDLLFLLALVVAVCAIRGRSGIGNAPIALAAQDVAERRAAPPTKRRSWMDLSSLLPPHALPERQGWYVVAMDDPSAAAHSPPERSRTSASRRSWSDDGAGCAATPQGGLHACRFFKRHQQRPTHAALHRSQRRRGSETWSASSASPKPRRRRRLDLTG